MDISRSGHALPDILKYIIPDMVVAIIRLIEHNNEKYRKKRSCVSLIIHNQVKVLQVAWPTDKKIMLQKIL